MVAGKLVAGVLGLLVAGIPGLLTGLLLGHLFDLGLRSALGFGGAVGAAAIRESFLQVSFQLMGYLAKADGRVSESEVAYTEAMFAQLRLSDQQRNEAIVLFKEGTQASFSPDHAIVSFLQQTGGHPVLKRTLLMFLVSIALADGELHDGERAALLRVGELLDYSAAQIDALLAMATAQGQFHGHGDDRRGKTTAGSLSDAYAALGVSAEASDQEVKRAYRRLMSENHPDKLASRGVPEEMMRLATERSQDITAAYELIKKFRGQ